MPGGNIVRENVLGIRSDHVLDQIKVTNTDGDGCGNFLSPVRVSIPPRLSAFRH